MASTSKSIAFKAALLLDPEYEYLRKSCSKLGNKGYARLKDPETKKTVLLHRYIYGLKNGTIPEEMVIDHEDQDKANNQLNNLRLANKSQNQHNVSLRKDSITKIKGLSIDARPNRRPALRAEVKFKGQPHRKIFEPGQEQEAIAWLEETRTRLHGDFANNG